MIDAPVAAILVDSAIITKMQRTEKKGKILNLLVMRQSNEIRREINERQPLTLIFQGNIFAKTQSQCMKTDKT